MSIDLIKLAISIKCEIIFISQYMGTLESRAEKMERFNKIHHDKWDIIRQEGLTQIAVDTKGREGEVNVVKIDPKRKLEQELEVYYYRRTHEGPLVKCYGAEALKTNSVGICGVDNTMKVITERIIKRFGQLPQLTVPEIIYSLGQALEGYQTLFKEVGAFEVNPDMLGINNKGDLHVWLNENFADNNPKLEKGILYTTAMVDHLNGVSTEKEMVDNILHMVEAKCEQGRFPQDLGNQMYSNSTFSDTINALHDYTAKVNIEVPDKIHPDNSKMYVSKTKGMLVTQANRSTVGKQQSFKFESSPNSETKKYDFESSTPAKQLKRDQFANSFGNEVYQTKYVSNSSNEVMTPKHATYESKEVKISGNPSYSPSYNYNYSYGDGKPANWSNSNDLRTNPNVNAAESVYESKQTISPVKDIGSAGYTFSNNKNIETSPNRVTAELGNRVISSTINTGIQSSSPANVSAAVPSQNVNFTTNAISTDKVTFGAPTYSSYATGVPTNSYTASNKVVTTTNSYSSGLKADVLSKSPGGEQIKNTQIATSGTAPKTTFTFSSNPGPAYQPKVESWSGPAVSNTVGNPGSSVLNEAIKNAKQSASQDTVQLRNKIGSYTSQYTNGKEPANPIMETSQVTKF